MPTSTFNPDADPETTSVDGAVRRTFPPGSFADIRTGAGTSATDDGTSNQAPIVQSTSNTDEYGRVDRAIFLFDTSALPNDATITAASLQLYITAKDDEFGSGSIAMVRAVPASNTALVASDYNIANWTMTRQATDVTISSITLNAYNSWTLNATGISNISLTGISKFGLVLAYDADATQPSWGSSKTADIVWNTANGANKPILSVTYSTPGGGTFLMNFI